LANEIPNSFHCNQYNNLANRQAHYEQTGPELWEQTDGKITHLIVATGTGGTITGTAMYLKEKNPKIKIWAIDVYGSLLKKYHETGEIDMKEVHPYITEGIGEDFVPDNYDMKLIDTFERVTDKDGAVMARRIVKEEGIFVGYSGGTALQGLMQLSSQLKAEDVPVVIFHDHGSRYVGKVYNDQWMMERGFLDVKTVKDIINSRPKTTLLSVNINDTVLDAINIMKKNDFEQLPVLENDEVIGSISEAGILARILENTNIKNESVKSIIQKPIPIVAGDTPLDRMNSYINKDNGAVLVRDNNNDLHIVTKYDLLKAL